MSLLSSGATLRILPGIEPTIFLYRDPGAPADEPAQDGLINGQVELVLRKRCTPTLAMHLQALARLRLPDGTVQDGTIEERSVEIGPESGETLEAGTHVFAFRLIVPAHTAPSENGSYGDIRHRLEVRGSGVGSFGSVLRDHVFLGLVTIPSAGPAAALPTLDARTEAFAPDLGPLALTLRSEPLKVSGLLAYRVVLPSPTAATTILLEISVQQSYSITPLRTSDQLSPTPSVHLLRSESIELVAGRSTSACGLARLPHGKFRSRDFAPVRASTLTHSKTPLAISHRVIVDITRQLDGEFKTLSISMPVHILSCLCTSDALDLPGYSSDFDAPEPIVMAPAARSTSYWRHRVSFRCACSQTDEEIKASDGPHLLNSIDPTATPNSVKASA